MRIHRFTRATVIAFAGLALVLGGATLAAAASGGHADSGVLLKDFFWRCLNFAVLFGLLAYFVTKPIRQGLKQRREGVAKTLEDAERTREAAEAKFAEYDAKLEQAAAEIEEIRASLKREGELERERVLAEAERMATRIREEAERSAGQEVARAQAELQREAARLAVQMAEDLLKEKITAADQERLVNEYTRKVGELH